MDTIKKFVDADHFAKLVGVEILEYSPGRLRPG